MVLGPLGFCLVSSRHRAPNADTESESEIFLDTSLFNLFRIAQATLCMDFNCDG